MDKLRIAVSGGLFALLSIGIVAGLSTGTLSGFGWDAFSLLCPFGAVTSMIAAHLVVPRGVVSLVLMVAFIAVFGRAFCGWVCPVPLGKRISGFFKSANRRKVEQDERRERMLDIARHQLSCGTECSECASCKQRRARFDSRHVVLGGALLSTVAFGFPVFCIVCPIGLAFATVLLVWRLFANGDVSILVVAVPALLVLEATLLRKWCARFCPLAAFMNLIGRFNRTFRPVIDESKCIESVSGRPCSRCSMVCEAEINVRHPEFGERTLDDCTRCRACVEACPAGALSLPLRSGRGVQEGPVIIEDNVDPSVLASKPAGE